MKLFDLLSLSDKNVGTYVGAKAVDSGGPLLESMNPSDGKVIATVKQSQPQDVDDILQHSHEVFKSWRQVPAPQRGELVRKIAERLREYKGVLGSLVALEMGKSKQEGDGEVQEMIDIADFAVGQSRMLYGNTMHSERPQHRMYEQWHPLGVVGIVTAFNFPVAVWAWNAFIAAIAGNVCVWKPSPKVPLCAIAVHQLCNQVCLDNHFPEIFSLFITSDNQMVEDFIADKRVNLVSFTGSSVVGKHVASLVAKRLGKYLLELSGNNAVIVDQSANLELVVPSVVFGAVGTAGQRCTTTRRVLVHESLYDQLLEKLIHAYQQITIGDPLDENNLMGPVCDQVAVDAYQAAIDAIKQRGKLFVGGKVLDRPGYFVEPAVASMPHDSELVQQETFVPILYVDKFSDIDQAIAQQNDVAQGLSSAIFTNDVKISERFLSSAGSDCGIANVNIGTSGAEIGGAFGGEKETGGGREAGSDAWKAYMRRQTNTINWSEELPLAQGIEFDL